MKRTRERLNMIRHFPQLLGALVVGMLLLPVTSAQAEPYFAIREGYKCSKCHVNMTGGGKRTDFANVYSQTRLPQSYVNWAKSGDASEEIEESEQAELPTSSFFSGRLNDFISIGADMRVEFKYTATPNQGNAHEFRREKNTLYLEADLVPDRAIMYWTDDGGEDARELFALLKGFPGNMYFKFGQFFLPYGLRMQDDSAFIRAETGFTYHTTDTGLEIGMEPGPFSFNLALTNGSGGQPGDTENNKQLTFSGAIISKGYRAGMSYTDNEVEGGNTTTISGLHAGTTFGRFTLLFEVDSISITDETGAETKEQAALAEMNYLISRGNNLKLSYDYLDPNKDVDEDQRDRISLVYEPFIYQFAQMRYGARINDAIPQNDAWNANIYFIEMHLFF